MRDEEEEIAGDDIEFDDEFEEKSNVADLETVWEKITRTYPGNASVVSRDLQNGQLGSGCNDEILVMLSPYINKSFSLHHINFSDHSRVTAKGLNALEECDFGELKSINLSNNPIQAEGLAALTSMLSPVLEELNLSNTNIMLSEEEDDGIKAIENFSNFLQELTDCTQLKYLNLNSKEPFPHEIIGLLADTLPWLSVNTFVFDNGITSKNDAIQALRMLEVGLRWNLTITTFEMPFWLGLANTKNDVCQRINKYFIRNVELMTLREKLSITPLNKSCTNIVLNYLYEEFEEFVAFINSKVGGQWIVTDELHTFELDERYTEKEKALQVKQKLESSLQSHFEEGEQIFQVEEKKGTFVVKMRMTPRQAILLESVPQTINQKSKSQKNMEADPNLPELAVFLNPTIQLMVGTLYEAKGYQSKAKTWYQAAGKNVDDLPEVKGGKSKEKLHSEVQGDTDKQDMNQDGAFDPESNMDIAVRSDKIQPLVTTLREPISLGFANLSNFFTTYFKFIESNSLRGSIEQELIYAITHLEVFHFSIKNNENYLPINEVNFLFKIFLKPAIGLDNNCLNYYVILFEHLQFLCVILKMRANSNKEKLGPNIDLEKMKKIERRPEANLFLKKETKKYKGITEVIMHFHSVCEKTFTTEFMTTLMKLLIFTNIKIFLIQFLVNLLNSMNFYSKHLSSH